jgi:hypothetical protein
MKGGFDDYEEVKARIRERVLSVDHEDLVKIMCEMVYMLCGHECANDDGEHRYFILQQSYCYETERDEAVRQLAKIPGLIESEDVHIDCNEVNEENDEDEEEEEDEDDDEA